MIDLKTLESAIAAATPLPWTLPNAPSALFCPNTVENAALIVASVNAMPALIAEVRRLEVYAQRYQWLLKTNALALTQIAWSVPAACAHDEAGAAIDAAIAHKEPT